MKKNRIYVSTLATIFLLLAGALVMIVPGGEIEVEAAGIPDLINISPLASPSSSGGGSGTYGPASLNDLTESNMCWVSTSSGGSSSAYVRLEWPTAHPIWKMKVIIHGSWSNANNRHLAGCKVEYYDGSSWVTDSVLSGIKGDFIYEFASVPLTTSIRMYDLKVTGSQSSNPCFYEWYVYESTSKTAIEAEFSPGFGIDQDIYPAQLGMGDSMYWAQTNVSIDSHVEDFRFVEMGIEVEAEEVIILRYDFLTNKFSKIGDNSRVMIFDGKNSTMAYDPNNITHNATVRFYYDFTFEWTRLDHVDVSFLVNGFRAQSSKLTFEDVFVVETRIEMEGNVTAHDSLGNELTTGDWVKGNSWITFGGVKRKYSNPAIPTNITPPDFIKVVIEDRSGIIHYGESSDLEDLVVHIESFYLEMEYWLKMIGVSGRNDMSDAYYKGYRLIVQIDSDHPGIPSELQIRPDSKDDQPQNYDDDPEVFLIWKDAVDQSSGVAHYHISVNMDKEEARATSSKIISMPKGSNAAPITDLPEGENKIYIWAEDETGNEGNSIFISVVIDLTPVWYSNFYPVTGDWINTLRPKCALIIHDDLTGVDPLSIQYEISTSGEVGLVGEWNTVSDPYAPGDELRVVVSGWFKNGKDNWIRFRAKDIAGNAYVDSDSFNVWVDAKSPTYRLLSHSEDEYLLNPLQEIRIQAIDEESNVDANTIEYRITTQGLTKWSQWLPYKEANDGPKPVISLKEHFKRGDNNYIQVRAKDKAGNPTSPSKAFNVKINTYPVIEIISPFPGDILQEKVEIIFNAGDSYDPDGDKVTISWYKSTPDGQESLGDSAQVSAKLDAGQYTITVIAKDRVNNQVQKTFTITVDKPDEPLEPWDQDTDLDKMYDWWERQFQTDPHVKDAQEDPDDDGFINLYEFENNTNPYDRNSHPAEEKQAPVPDDLKLFSSDAWPLWALLGVIILAIILTMFVTKSKKDKQVNRIKTVRNMRKIMPSVSWDQITTTAYMAPMTGGGPALPAAAGPALPSGAPAGVPDDQALPPAQEADVAAHEAAHVVQQQEAAPAPAAPEPAPVPAPAPIPTPEPAPAPAGTVPQPETPPAQNNLPPQ